jgi:phosphoesterase RecJ-like protein
MVTDSGRFRYSSTNTETYKIASELMKYKIDTEYIYNKIYMDKLANVKLKAKLIDKFVVLESGVAYLINTKEEIKEYNVPIYDVSRGMVNIMAGIEEICIWANFSEDESGDIYCEFRSNGKNINVVATKYGGGGHLQASGTTVYSFDTVKEIIQDLERVARGEECL